MIIMEEIYFVVEAYEFESDCKKENNTSDYFIRKYKDFWEAIKALNRIIIKRWKVLKFYIVVEQEKEYKNIFVASKTNNKTKINLYIKGGEEKC